MTAIKYTLTYASNGREIATGRTEKQAAAIALRSWTRSGTSDGISIVGTDGLAYELLGHKRMALVGRPVAPVVMTAEQSAKLDLYRTLDAAPRAPQERAYDDAEACEDLGIQYR